MISDLQAKVIAEGEEAQKVYEEFSEFCEERSKDLMHEVKVGKAEVKDLTAVIDEESSTIESRTTKVGEVSATLASAEKDLKAATEVREKEAADSKADEKEISDTIEKLKNAISVIEKGGASMLQLKGATSITNALSAMVEAQALNAADGKRLTALVQAGAEDESDVAENSASAPAAAGYEAKGGGIVETLQGLLDKAEAQLEEIRTKEEDDAHNYEMLKQGLSDEIRTSTKIMEKTKKDIAAASEKKATAEGDLDVTSKDLSEDERVLAGVHQDCMNKASTFEADTKGRGEELNALATAKKVIKEATGAAMSQVSFLQARSTSNDYQIVRFVRHLAQKQQSRALAQLASKMASAVRSSSKSGADPFAKIKGLIGDMVSKLEKEGEEAAQKHAYCEKEMGESKTKHEEKSTEIEKLTTSIEDMSAQSAKLKETVGRLQTELASIASAQSEMDHIRAKENKDFLAAKAEIETGLAGIKKALQVLKDYYGKSEGGSGGGIIDLLETVESDFEKSLAEVVGDEETAVRAYDQETKQNEMQVQMKTQDVKYKTQESTDLDKAVAETSADLESVQKEISAVNEYWTQLKEECVGKVDNEKAKRREAEIAGLKEALETLEGAFLLQLSSTHKLRGVKSHA